MCDIPASGPSGLLAGVWVLQCWGCGYSSPSPESSFLLSSLLLATGGELFEHLTGLLALLSFLSPGF